VFVAFVIPAATSEWFFAIATFVVGLVEGICLVATPALIRDFSPQVGRATAMGFWTSGPVVGSLVVAVVGSATIPSVVHDPGIWTHQYRICGIAGLVVWLIALVGLRELSPRLRDQLMVTIRDRALVEARAKGLSERRVIFRHGVRAALTPVVSQLGVDIGQLLGGVIVVETVFGLNGLGQVSVQAIDTDNLPVIIGFVVLAAAFVVVANIIVDLVYALLDPRVRIA